MNYFANLPAARIPRNALLDFSPINNAIDSNRQNALQTRQLDMRQEEQTYQRGRDAKQDARVEQQDMRQQVQLFGKRAEAIDQITDPAQRQVLWGKIIASHPNREALTPEYLDPMNGPKLVMAEAGQWRDPRDSQAKDLEIQKTQAEISNLQRQASGRSEYGLQPILGTDENGQTVVMQVGKNGQLIRSQTPPGVTVDYGLKAGQAATGKARAEATVDLPKVTGTAERLNRQIDGVLNDPNLPNVTGWQANLPTFRSSNVDVEEKAGQLASGAFVQAFQDLKGGGAITEIEGSKATSALARLANLRQSDQGYREALQDFKTEVANLVSIAQRRAGGGQAPPQAAPAAPPANGGWSIQRID